MVKVVPKVFADLGGGRSQVTVFSDKDEVEAYLKAHGSTALAAQTREQVAAVLEDLRANPKDPELVRLFKSVQFVVEVAEGKGLGFPKIVEEYRPCVEAALPLFGQPASRLLREKKLVADKEEAKAGKIPASYFPDLANTVYHFVQATHDEKLKRETVADICFSIAALPKHARDKPAKVMVPSLIVDVVPTIEHNDKGEYNVHDVVAAGGVFEVWQGRLVWDSPYIVHTGTAGFPVILDKDVKKALDDLHHGKGRGERGAAAIGDWLKTH